MFHLAAGSPWLGGMFAGCTQIALLRLPVSAESLRRKTVQVGGYLRLRSQDDQARW
jgi:hypothetical protein